MLPLFFFSVSPLSLLGCSAFQCFRFSFLVLSSFLFSLLLVFVVVHCCCLWLLSFVVAATTIVGCSCWVNGKNEGPLLCFFRLMVGKEEASYVLVLFFGVLEVVEIVLGVGYVCSFRMM